MGGNDGLSVRAHSTADPNGLNSPGSILIEARGATSDVVINSDIESGRGHISLLAGDDILLQADILSDGTQSTSGAEGSVQLVAFNGTLNGAGSDGVIMADNSSISSVSGVIRLVADNESDIVLGRLDTVAADFTAGAVSLVAERSILDGAGDLAELNIQTGTLRMWADAVVNADGTQDTLTAGNQQGLIGGPATANGQPEANLNAIDIQVVTLAARSAEGIYLSEADGLTVDATGNLSISEVNFNSTLTTRADLSLADLVTSHSGPIKLVSLAGTLTFNDGATGALGGNDGLSVRAHSTADPNGLNSPGSILIEARGAASDVVINSDIESGRGHISLLAGDDILLQADILTDGTQSTSGAEGSVQLVAFNGTLNGAGSDGVIMADNSSISSVSGVIRLVADNESDIVLGRLDTVAADFTAGAVSLVAERSILDGAGDLAELSIQTGTLRMWADAVVNADGTQDTLTAGNQNGLIGGPATANGQPEANLNAIDIQVVTLAARSAEGIYLSEADGLTVDATGNLSISEVNFNSTLTTRTDLSLADLVTSHSGPIKLVSLAGTLTLNDGRSRKPLGGNDGLSVRAHSTADPNGLNSPGSILIEARGTASDLVINSDIESGRGHISLLAGDDILLQADILSDGTQSTSGAEGSVQLVAFNGTLNGAGSDGVIMADNSSISSVSGVIRLVA